MVNSVDIGNSVTDIAYHADFLVLSLKLEIVNLTL